MAAVEQDPAPPPGFSVIQDEPPPPPGFEIVPPETVPAPVPAVKSTDTQSTVTERYLDSTAVGRVLDAFGQGAKAGWGAGPIGLSPESEQVLQDLGVFNDAELTLTTPFKTFNEAIIRPLAAGLEAATRGVSAVITGTAGAVGQTAQELGEDPAMANRLTRDTLALAETFMIVSGTVVPRPSVGRTSRPVAVAEDVGARRAPEPVARPTEVYSKAETPAVDKAGNINLNRIQAPEDVKAVIREAATAGEGFLEARRGTMSLAQTEDLAQSLGMTPAELAKRNVGQAFNAEEAVAARNLLVQSATNVRELAGKAAGGSEADLLAFQEAITRHMTVQEQVAGLTAEAGRALSSFRIMASASKEAKALSQVIDDLGGRRSIEDMARMIGELDTPQQVSKFLIDSRTAKASDMLIELWINALLSGPQTHAVNITSNALVALWTTAETGVAATVGAARAVVGGARERVLFGEMPARLFGFVQGAQEGVRAGWRAYKTESPGDAGLKVEVRRQQAIPSAKVSLAGREFEIGGKQVRIPGRLLGAEDAFFKAIGYRQELNALAYRQASKEGLAGDAFKRRVADLVNNPSEAMTLKARNNADYQTFTKPLGETGKAVQRFANSHPLFKVIIPFIRTPVNLLKFSGERSVLSAFSKQVRADLKGANGAVAQDTQIARIAMGTAVGVAIAAAAAQGLVTGGGPKDPRQRAVMYLNGWAPYSVKIGDMYYSYSRIEPLGTLLGVPADMYEIGSAMTDAEAADIAALVLASVSKNLVSKSWLQGPSDLIEAVNDFERYGDRWLQRMAGTVVPTGLAQVARVEDPFLRDARTTLDAIRARVPGLSQDVPPRRDIWGEPIALEGGLGPDLLSPIYQRKINNDPVNRELLRLQIWPARLDREIHGVELSAEQYDNYQIVAGRLAKHALDQVVRTDWWPETPAFVQQDIIKGTITRSRETARSQVLMRYPSLFEKVVNARVEAATGKKSEK